MPADTDGLERDLSESDLQDLDAARMVAPGSVLAELERRLTETGPDASLLALKARAQISLGQVDEARSTIAEAQQLPLTTAQQSEVALAEGHAIAADGDTQAAVEYLAGAIDRFSGVNTAPLYQLMTALNGSLRRHDANFRDISAGLAVAERFGDIRSRRTLLMHDAVARLETGEIDAARSQLETVISLADDANALELRLYAQHNLAVVNARSGDMQLALEQFVTSRSLALPAYALAGVSLDEGETLLDAGLFDEAWQAGRRAERAFRSARSEEVVHALLLQARASVAAHRWRRASEEIEGLREALSRQPSDGVKEQQSRVNALDALIQAHLNPTALRERLDELGGSDAIASDDGRVAVDLSAVLDAQGHPELATQMLRDVATSPRASTSAISGLFAGVAKTLLTARLDGPAAAEAVAESTLAEGFVLLDRLPSMELRQEVARGVRSVGSILTGSYVARGETSRLHAHLEELYYRLQAAETITGDDQSALLHQLRTTTRALSNLATGSPEALRLHTKRTGIEGRLRELRRLTPSPPLPQRSGAGEPFIGLCYLTVADGQVTALLTAERSDFELITLGQEANLRRNIAALRSILSARAFDSATDEWRPVRDAISVQLAPLTERFAGSKTLIVPDPDAALVPWTMITPFPVSTIPAQAFVPANSPRPAKRAVVGIAGPGLASADDELDALRAAYGNRLTAFPSDCADSEPVLEAINGASLAHFACHGTMRPDHALLSSLELTDGPMTFYELMREQLPDYMILAACDVGRLLGSSSTALACSFLLRGCRAFVASMGAINDVDTQVVMASIHKDLARGEDFVTTVHSRIHEAVETAPSLGQLLLCGGG